MKKESQDRLRKLQKEARHRAEASRRRQQKALRKQEYDSLNKLMESKEKNG
jgi:hypothetical protein